MKKNVSDKMDTTRDEDMLFINNNRPDSNANTNKHFTHC